MTKGELLSYRDPGHTGGAPGVAQGAHTLAGMTQGAHTPAGCLVATLRRFQTLIEAIEMIKPRAPARRSTGPLRPRSRPVPGPPGR
jgi:hypothetical protein